MAPSIYISIPHTSVVSEPKPHTVYEISVRLPLQTLALRKRYSDFVELHGNLTSQAGSPPPTTLPPKHWFTSTIKSETLTESRRTELESYLTAINRDEDARWRETSAWRVFLNLPSGLSSRSSRASVQQSGTAGPSGGAVSDPTEWLDVHRELKGLLHEARFNVAARERTGDVGASHENAAEAKKLLVRAGTLVAGLEKGLKVSQGEWGAERLGEGEVRRRRDLVAGARKEKEDLERLLTAMARKREVDEAVDDKRTLVAGSDAASGGMTARATAVKKGRVLGKETAATRELDNKGVLQLQQQMLQDQDQGLNMLAATVLKQKELATQINEELEIQLQMLELVNEDATRVEGKLGVARDRVGKIS